MEKTTRWQGTLNLEYQYKYPQTRVTQVYHVAPLKVQRSFYPEGKNICQTMILNTAGGIVETDRLEQQIYLNNNARVSITTASAGKIYRSEKAQAQQHVNIQIESGGYLEFFPQENIIFSGANYYQKLKVELAPQAEYLGWEINRFGRSARGEKFLTGTWLSVTEISREGKPIWIDRQALWGEKNLFTTPNGLANKPVVGTFSWIGLTVTPEIITTMRCLGENLEGETGVTQLIEGLVCRYRGYSTTEVKQWFRAIANLKFK